MYLALAVLLHVGHAKNELEAALTAVGFVATLVGLGVAAMALWPRTRPGVKAERTGRTERLRALREAESQSFDEEVDRGT
jgi:hypothetical protein